MHEVSAGDRFIGPRTNTVLFDFDGVLVDSETVQRDIWRTVLRTFGLSDGSVEPANFVGMLDRQSVPKLAPGSSRTLQSSIIRMKQALMRRQRAAGIPLVEGAGDCLRRVARHCAIGIASNSPRDLISTTLAEHNLSTYVTTIAGAERGLPHKPDPAIYLELMRQLDVSPDSCLVIEDSLVGLAAATRAGVPTIGFAHLFESHVMHAYCDHCVTGLDQIAPTVSR